MHKYCLSIESSGRVTSGAGFLVGFRSPHPLDSRPNPSFKAWMMQVVTTVLETGDRVFDEVTGDAAAISLARALGEVKSHEGFHVESMDGVPALQADTLDGRRLEVDYAIQKGERKPVIRRELREPAGPRELADGITSVRRHAIGRFRFRLAPTRLVH